MTFLADRLKRLSQLINTTVFSRGNQTLTSDEMFSNVHEIFENIIKQQKKVFVVGNGGSCGIASHHVVDLVNVIKVPSFTLADNNLLTCMANDYGYETSFARPLSCMAAKGDLLIAISSSGQSKNILEACQVMQQKGGQILTLSGFKASNPLRQLGDLNIWTGEQDYGLVETAHFFILHSIVDGWTSRATQREKQQEIAVL